MRARNRRKRIYNPERYAAKNRRHYYRRHPNAVPQRLRFKSKKLRLAQKHYRKYRKQKQLRRQLEKQLRRQMRLERRGRYYELHREKVRAVEQMRRQTLAVKQREKAYSQRRHWILTRLLRMARDDGTYKALAHPYVSSRTNLSNITSRLVKMARDDGTYEALKKEYELHNERPQKRIRKAPRTNNAFAKVEENQKSVAISGN